MEQMTAQIIPFKQQRFYATFGQGHEHKNCYVEIEAATADDARQAMFAIFEAKWAFSYSYDKFKGQPERWGYRPIGVIYFTGDCGWQWDSAKKGEYGAR